MRKTVKKLTFHLSDRAFMTSLAVGILFLATSLVLNYYAGTYAAREASNAVTDIILDNLPVMDVDFIFVEGAIVLWIFSFLVAIREPRSIPFALKSIALFIFVRSIFISMTHLGPFPDQIFIAPNKVFNFGADLFFSGHTGFPFLFALIFWENKWLRTIFVASSIFFGVSVLLGHLHYSIDVFSAFFITFGIFHLAKSFFKKDYALFKS